MPAHGEGGTAGVQHAGVRGEAGQDVPEDLANKIRASNDTAQMRAWFAAAAAIEPTEAVLVVVVVVEVDVVGASSVRIGCAASASIGVAVPATEALSAAN